MHSPAPYSGPGPDRNLPSPTHAVATITFLGGSSTEVFPSIEEAHRAIARAWDNRHEVMIAVLVRLPDSGLESGVVINQFQRSAVLAETLGRPRSMAGV